MSVELRVNLGKFRGEMKILQKNVDESAERGLRSALRKFETTFKATRLSGGEGLGKRTGELSRSFNILIRREKSGWVGEYASSSPYGAIHEESGVIRAKNKPWLWIPATELQTAAGVFRGWGQVNWNDVFIKPSRRNPANKVALERRGNTVRHVATLTRQVHIPARMGLGDLFVAQQQVHIDEVLRVMRTVKGVN